MLQLPAVLVDIPDISGVCVDGGVLSSAFQQQKLFSTQRFELKNSRAAPAVKAEAFNFWEVLGGRGLGEQKVNTLNSEKLRPLFNDAVLSKSKSKTSSDDEEDYDFEKELGGLTGGFPGGETGIEEFVKKNPPPEKPLVMMSEEIRKIREEIPKTGTKLRSVPPPLFMPGMTVIVTNPKDQYYMYTGILQRVTDDRAGVLLEGGCWDKMIAVKLKDLKRAKPPPMSNPKSAVLLEDDNKLVDAK